MLGNRCGIWIVGFWLCLAAAVGVADAQATDAEASDRSPIRQLSDATEAEFANYIAWLHAQPMTVAERAAHFARLSVGRPYEGGEKAARMLDHRKADCVTLVNQSLAVAMADSWDSYCRLVVRLCYANGEIPLAPSQFVVAGSRLMAIAPADEPLLLLNRNHYLIAEWNRNNAWCLTDITKDLGAGPIKPWIPLHHIVRRTEMFAKRGVQVDTPPEKVIDAFIPREAFPLLLPPPGVEDGMPGAAPTNIVPGEIVCDILSELQPGDVVQVIRGTLENRYCDHTGIIIREPWDRIEDSVQIVHAAPPYVRREPLVQFLNGYRFVEGLKFLRLKPEAQAAAAQEAAAMTSRMVVPAAAAE